MPSPKVASFNVRAPYPNLRTVLESLASRAPSPDHEKLPGYYPPEVSYQLLDSKETQSTRLREADILPLQHSDTIGAKDHLTLILAAKGGNAAASEELDAASATKLSEIDHRLRRARSRESRHIVPSVSLGDHPRTIVSHKGSKLLKLYREGYPVPDFVILTTAAYEERAKLESHLGEALETLSLLTDEQLGGAGRPLVLALRCAMPNYFPGLMPTYLNVGVTRETLDGLSIVYGKKAALRMYLNNLRNLLDGLEADAMPEEIRDDEAALEEAARRSEAAVRDRDPELVADPFRQLVFFAHQAYLSFHANADLLATLSRGILHHPSLILQKMVCSVREETSYAGVLFSRHPRTGSGHQIETARNVFGEEIMTGTTASEQQSFSSPDEIRETYPGVSHVTPILENLEREYEFPVTLEFVTEAGGGHELFALLQLNQTGMTGRGAFISSVDMHQAGIITRKRVTELICPYHIKQIESDTIDQLSFQELKRFCRGVSILPRAAVCARIYFSAEAALKAKKRGESVCFCKRTFSPTDTVVMREVDAILSLTSAAIHVVTICQSFGTPALLSLENAGVSLQGRSRLLNQDGDVIKEGDHVTISSRRQALFKGEARFQPARFMRYLEGDDLSLTDEEHRAFADMAYAYRYYQKLVHGLQFEEVSTLREVIRLVNLELRGKGDEARHFVRNWFSHHEETYTAEVLRSELGDHLNQHTVFDMLLPEQRVSFLKRALDECGREHKYGYEAGAFMLGRFIAPPQPVSFWSNFTPFETALLLNEWLLFEKYMQVLYVVGERKLNRARAQILREGLGTLQVTAATAINLVPLKLAGVCLEEVGEAAPDDVDPQLPQLLELLGKPYGAFFDYDAPWSLRRLEAICEEAGIAVPDRDEGVPA